MTSAFKIKKAERTGGAFFSLKDLAENGPVLVLFRIIDFLAPEKAQGFDGTNVPVIADAVVCDGPRKGEVHLSEKFMGSITAQLRGVANPKAPTIERPKGIPVSPPETEVGDLILARIKVMNPGKSNASAAGDPPSDADVDAVGAWYTPDVWNTPEAAEATAAATSAASDKPWLKG
jgi:hypothetical protein